MNAPELKHQALARVVAAVHQRWGAGSLSPLSRRSATYTSAPPAQEAQEVGVLPPWWPGATSRDGRPLPVPSVLEVGVTTPSGRLTFMLAWAAALRPDLLAIIDLPVEDGARLYPPSIVAAGLTSSCRPIVVRPGGRTPSNQGTSREAMRAVVDALLILLRSEAFDAILCPIPAPSRLTNAVATTLARAAARAGTTLVVLTGPRTLLGPSATYRLVIADHRWTWCDGELAGLRLEVHTHRARGGAEAVVCASELHAPRDDSPGALATHVLDFRLRRTMRDGPGDVGGAMGMNGASWELSGVAPHRLAEYDRPVYHSPHAPAWLIRPPARDLVWPGQRTG